MILFTTSEIEQIGFGSKVKFPTQNNRICNIADNNQNKQRKIVDQANNVRPIIYAPVMSMLHKFITLKKDCGTSVEKNVYSSMGTSEFIDRLLSKRPLMFMTEGDSYVLRNNTKGSGGFEAIGTTQEKSPLTLADYLSYDEMQIAALIGVSAPTFFINDGNRHNKAKLGKPGTFEEEGVYVGLVGARFEKQGLMEWQHMIITPEQNNAENGYSSHANATNPKTQLLGLWKELYGESFVTFAQTQADKSGRYILLEPQKYLDSVVYKKRMKMVIEPFLADANERGKIANKKVYCHAVGLGLGVWQKTPAQAKLLLEVYADIIKSRKLPYISDINFSWFPAEYQTCDGVGNGKPLKTEDNEIAIHFSNRNPADKLTGSDLGKLLVAQYAWDGNSYPGNEYWDNHLAASGDPAAACCSTISELQNPEINPNVSSQQIFVCESNSKDNNGFQQPTTPKLNRLSLAIGVVGLVAISYGAYYKWKTKQKSQTPSLPQ